MNKLSFLSCFLLLISIKCLGQLSELKAYLNATKTIEFDESQKVIKELSFSCCKQYIISTYSDINGLAFDTDAKGVKGYKAIFNCKAQNKAGTFIEKRMMAILYYDKIYKKWRVFEIREPVASCDEMESAKKSIDITRSQYSWRSVSYWAIMCGKLLEAKDAVETSESRARAVNDKEFVNTYADIVKRIL